VNRRGGIVLVAAGSLLSACLQLEPPAGDRIPPVVLEMTPRGEQVPLDSEVSVLFSEPVLLGERDGLVVLLPGAEVDAELLADLDKPPLGQKRAARCLPCTVSVLLDGQQVRLVPEQRLEPGRDYTVVVSAALTDRAGNPLVDRPGLDEAGRPLGVNTHWLGEFRTRTGGVRLNEILANPAGVEARGEFVEVVNLTGAPVDLSGWRLDDSGGSSPGDELQPCPGRESRLLASGRVALLVGRDFVPPDDLDDGVALWCSDHASLTSRGLRNSAGETLVLIDAAGREQDRYGGWLDSSDHEGCSLQRRDPLQPDGEDNWYLQRGQPCSSPGRLAAE